MSNQDNAKLQEIAGIATQDLLRLRSACKAIEASIVKLEDVDEKAAKANPLFKTLGTDGQWYVPPDRAQLAIDLERLNEQLRKLKLALPLSEARDALTTALAGVAVPMRHVDACKAKLAPLEAQAAVFARYGAEVAHTVAQPLATLRSTMQAAVALLQTAEQRVDDAVPAWRKARAAYVNAKAFLEQQDLAHAARLEVIDDELAAIVDGLQNTSKHTN